MAAIAKCTSLRLPSCDPRFESQAHHQWLSKFVLHLSLYWERNKNKQTFLKDWLLKFMLPIRMLKWAWQNFRRDCFFCKMCLLIIKSINYCIYNCSKKYLTQNYTHYTIRQRRIKVQFITNKNDTQWNGVAYWYFDRVLSEHCCSIRRDCFFIKSGPHGQSCKASTIVIYESRVVNKSKLIVMTTLLRS